MEMGHGQRRSVLILWGWTALLSAFVLYPVFTDQGVSYIPIGAAMLGLVLYTVLHPQIRRQRSARVSPAPCDRPLRDPSRPSAATVCRTGLV